MASTWTKIDGLKILSGSPVARLGQVIFDRLRIQSSRPTSWRIPTNSTSSSSFVTIATLFVRVPEFARPGDKLRTTVFLRNTQSGSTAYFRIREAGEPTNGSEVSAGDVYAAVSSEVTIPAGGWSRSIKKLEAQIRTDGTGTAAATTDGTLEIMLCNFAVVPA